MTVFNNEVYRLSQVNELVQRKREGAEKMRLDNAEINNHEQRLDCPREMPTQAAVLVALADKGR